MIFSKSVMTKCSGGNAHRDLGTGPGHEAARRVDEFGDFGLQLIAAPAPLFRGGKTLHTGPETVTLDAVRASGSRRSQLPIKEVEKGEFIARAGATGKFTQGNADGRGSLVDIPRDIVEAEIRKRFLDPIKELIGTDHGPAIVIGEESFDAFGDILSHPWGNVSPGSGFGEGFGDPVSLTKSEAGRSDTDEGHGLRKGNHDSFCGCGVSGVCLWWKGGNSFLKALS